MNMLRTHKLNEVNEKLIGKNVILTGWVDSVREHGNVVFIDLRDRYGKVQSVISKKTGNEFEKAKKLTMESCIALKGEVKQRPKGTENKELDSGKVEVSINEIEIYNLCEMLPFKINDKETSEDIRLRYRFLDLRSKRMQKNLLLRNKTLKIPLISISTLPNSSTLTRLAHSAGVIPSITPLALVSTKPRS